MIVRNVLVYHTEITLIEILGSLSHIVFRNRVSAEYIILVGTVIACIIAVEYGVAFVDFPDINIRSLTVFFIDKVSEDGRVNPSTDSAMGDNVFQSVECMPEN